jgi:hypothetical protein
MLLSLGGYHWGCAQLLDELEVVSRWCLSVVAQQYLLESLVVDEAGGIFWDFQLPLLYVLPEFPRKAR